jgi:hypothetical protein
MGRGAWSTTIRQRWGPNHHSTDINDNGFGNKDRRIDGFGNTDEKGDI